MYTKLNLKLPSVSGWLRGSLSRQEQYELIVSSYFRPSGTHANRRIFLLTLFHIFTFRRLLTTFIGFVALSLLVVSISGIPPSYADIYAYEDQLPQHHRLPSEGTRYLHISNQLTGHGFNNVLQQALLISFMAHRANRSYVFEDHAWVKKLLPWKIYDFSLKPIRTPLNAFISGPTAGLPSHSPAAVSERYWNDVCPMEKRVKLDGARAPVSVDTTVVMDWWLGEIEKAGDAQCLELDYIDMDARSNMTEVWESYSASPIIQNFAWSPLVQSAVIRNMHMLKQLSLDNSPEKAQSELPGLVAMHIRRGDFVRHCPRLWRASETYTGVNMLPSLLDQFEPPPDASSLSEARYSYYMKHCFPSVEQYVERLHQVRAENPSLHKVYVSTNGGSWFTNRLRDALLNDGWESFISIFDLVLDAQQKYVGMAVDMAISEKAEVFLGNGFSSLSSNVILLRLARGSKVESNRLL